VALGDSHCLVPARRIEDRVPRPGQDEPGQRPDPALVLDEENRLGPARRGGHGRPGLGDRRRAVAWSKRNVGPATNSVTMKSWSSIRQQSYTVTRFGWLSEPMSRDSR
jgi:hypothetical protein